MKKLLLTLSLLLTAVPAILAANPKKNPAPASPRPEIVFNRAPLTDDAFAELPLGAIKPQGWLLDQLERQRDGMTGHLDSLYAPVVGDDNAWIGGEGDTWERGPYWIDGLLPLAYILDDEVLIAKPYSRPPGKTATSAMPSPAPISKACSAAMPRTGGPRW